VIAGLPVPVNAAWGTPNSWFCKGLKDCSSLHLTGTESARASHGRDEHDARAMDKSILGLKNFPSILQHGYVEMPPAAC